MVACPYKGCGYRTNVYSSFNAHKSRAHRHEVNVQFDDCYTLMTQKSPTHQVLCAVYWVFADLPTKCRSALSAIQLAVLCKVSDVESYGYDQVLGPLIKDIRVSEKDGVFVEALGKCIKGTALCCC